MAFEGSKIELTMYMYAYSTYVITCTSHVQSLTFQIMNNPACYLIEVISCNGVQLLWE